MGRKKRTSNPGRAIAYVRVSTEEQNLGPEAQRASLERWCASEGVELVAIFEDRLSGGLGLDSDGMGLDLARRPGLMQAVDALADLGAGVLLVAKRDRLFRDSMATAMVERLAQRSGAVIRSADGTGNGTGPEAMLMARMVDAFAEYERALIRARTTSALAVKKSKGERIGAIPFGQRLAADGIHLEDHPAEQEAIQIIETLREDGLSYRKIAAELTARGITPRGKTWHPTTVTRIVKALAA